MNSAMIVDDEPFIVEMLSDILENMDVQVVGAASDGAEAVDRYSVLDPPPGFILMDYRMPHMNGIEATRKILKVNPGARVLFVSADSTIIDDALNAGALGFLVKPFTIAALKRAIDDIME